MDGFPIYTKELKPLTAIVYLKHDQTIDDHIIKECPSKAWPLLPLPPKTFAISFKKQTKFLWKRKLDRVLHLMWESKPNAFRLIFW